MKSGVFSVEFNVESKKIGTCKAADAEPVNYPPDVSEYRDLTHCHF